MNVPLLDLKGQFQSLKNELNDAILRVAETQALILGPEVDKLEATLAEYCGVRHALGVSSGTDALLMALMALNLQPGDEVIVPTFSFFATAGVVSRLNLVPVFCDVEPKTLCLDPEDVRRRITSKTKAIIPVHLYGQSADMDQFMQISEEFGIPIIEDAAQAIGTQYHDGRRVGSMGLMGCFSFYPTKNLGAFGDAGFITTNDTELYQHLKLMRVHGMERQYYYNFVGGNFRIDAIQAAVLNVKMPHLESWHQKRRDNAALYEEILTREGVSRPGDVIFAPDNEIVLPPAVYRQSGVTNHHIYNQFVIRSRHRNALKDFLASKSIGSAIYYPLSFHKQDCFAHLNPPKDSFPQADCAALDSLALPVYPELTPEQITYVAETLVEFVRDHAPQLQQECCGRMCAARP